MEPNLSQKNQTVSLDEAFISLRWDNQMQCGNLIVGRDQDVNF